MTSNTHILSNRRHEILAEIESLDSLVEGKICERKSGNKITGYRLQRHRNGKNDTKYVTASEVDRFEAGIKRCNRLKALLGELILLGEETFFEETSDSKKKPTRR